MKRKQTKITDDTKTPPRKVGRPRKQSSLPAKRTRGRKSAVQADLPQAEMEVLGAVTRRISTTYGPLAIMAMTQLFKWFEKVHHKLASVISAQMGKTTTPVAPATRKLIHDLVALRGLVDGSAPAPRATNAAGKKRKVTRRRRKAKQNKTTLTIEAPAPKRRGRPRKVDSLAASASTQTKAAKRTRARRKATAEQSGAESATPAPKRRGRPRKADSLAASASTQTKAAKRTRARRKATAEQSGAESATPAPKRRGRPRKTPVPVQTVQPQPSVQPTLDTPSSESGSQA